LASATLPVDNIDGKIAALAQSMIETMYRAPGVGLAANQIGIQKRMFVYDAADGKGPRTVINPQIVETSGEWLFEEGCLSVPGLTWEIARPNKVHLKGFDLDGNEIDIETDEYEARIFQHEVDHLDGHLLLHRLTEEQRKGAKRELRKMQMSDGTRGPADLTNLLGH
jgi:peptide deformylase